MECASLTGGAFSGKGSDREEKRMIETERLILRELREEDFEALFSVLADSDILRHSPYTFDEKRVRNWIAKNRARYGVWGFGLWAVVWRETGEMIGDCGLTVQEIDGAFCPEIGYHIAARFQRRGIASEAARAVRDWTFERTPFRELFSYMKADNLPSARWRAKTGCGLCGSLPTRRERKRACFPSAGRIGKRGNKREKRRQSIRSSSSFHQRRITRTGLPRRRASRMRWAVPREVPSQKARTSSA